MGLYTWAFQFDNPEIDAHMTFGQGISTIHSLIKRISNRICCLRNYDNHY
jgi:hypothetical protein